MNISRAQITVAVSVIALVIIALALSNRPQQDPVVPKAGTGQEEQVSDQPGKYELPVQDNPSRYTYSPNATAPKTTAQGPAAENSSEADRKTLNNEPSKPEVYAPAPDLPPKPPKYPSPETLKQMQKRGIVAF